MSTILGIDTAIGWAHWRLRGGWKSALLTTTAYAGIVTSIILVTVRMNPRDLGTMLSGWKLGLLWIQVGILLLYGGGRVMAAVRSDINLRLIESHRLMPIAPACAISGYLWGPTAQVMVLAMANFVIGAVVTLAAGINLSAWIGPNVILATFAVFCWVVAAYISSLTKAAPGLLFGLLMSLTASQGLALIVAPGAAVIISPLIGKTIFVSSASSTDLSFAMIVSALAQGSIGAVLYTGAARKYRRSEDTAMAVIPGLLLLAAWVGVSCVALQWWSRFQPDFTRFLRTDSVRLIGSFISAMLLAAVPIANAARDPRRRAVSPLVAAACAAIILVLCVPMRQQIDAYTWAVAGTALVLVAYAISLCFLLRIVYRVTPRGIGIATAWVLLSWFVPFIGEYFQWLMLDTNTDYALTSIGGFSPVGALIVLWNELDVNIDAGLAFQCGLALLWALIYGVTRTRPRGTMGSNSEGVA